MKDLDNNYRNLWIHVILTAFLDLKFFNSKSRSFLYYKSSIAFFNIENKNFTLVCDCAGFDPLFIIDAFNKYCETNSIPKFVENSNSITKERNNFEEKITKKDYDKQYYIKNREKKLKKWHEIYSKNRKLKNNKSLYE